MPRSSRASASTNNSSITSLVTPSSAASSSSNAQSSSSSSRRRSSAAHTNNSAVKNELQDAYNSINVLAPLTPLATANGFNDPSVNTVGGNDYLYASTGGYPSASPSASSGGLDRGISGISASPPSPLPPRPPSANSARSASSFSGLLSSSNNIGRGINSSTSSPQHHHSQPMHPWSSVSGAAAAAAASSYVPMSLADREGYMQIASVAGLGMGLNGNGGGVGMTQNSSSGSVGANSPVMNMPSSSDGRANFSSPFMLDYAPPRAEFLSQAMLTPEQQSQMYADFVAGRHLNSFNTVLPQQPVASSSHLSSSHAHAQQSAAAASGGGGGGKYSDSDMSSGSDDDDEGGSRKKRKRDNASGHNAKQDFGDDPNDKERLGKRLARKAELARASRKRKKAYVQDLESKVKKLNLRIEELQAKASNNRSLAPSHVLVDEDAQRKTAQQTIRATMSALLASQSQPGELTDASSKQHIQELVRQFVENSRDRQAQVETYLDRVQESLTPGLQAKFAMWGLDQNDEFYTKPGLWTSLMMKEIELTPAQLASILGQRSAIRQERKNMATIDAMIKELRNAAVQHLRSLHQTMDIIQTIMTPTQLARFYLWVENNEWTMSMLNSSLGFGPSRRQQALAATKQDK